MVSSMFDINRNIPKVDKIVFGRCLIVNGIIQYLLEMSIFYKYFSSFEAGNCVSNIRFKRRKIEKNNLAPEGLISVAF